MHLDRRWGHPLTRNWYLHLSNKTEGRQDTQLTFNPGVTAYTGTYWKKTYYSTKKWLKLGTNGICDSKLRAYKKSLEIWQWLTDRRNRGNHRITKWSGLEGTSVGHPFQPPCRSRVTYSRLHSTSSRWVLNISREGDSTTSLGSLGQGSVTLRGKKFFLVFSWNFLCFSLCPLPLVLMLGTTEKSLAPSSWPPPCRYL